MKARAELLKSLPNGLRAYILTYEKNMRHAATMREEGEITCEQYKNFRTLLAMAESQYQHLVTRGGAARG